MGTQTGTQARRSSLKSQATTTTRAAARTAACSVARSAFSHMCAG